MSTVGLEAADKTTRIQITVDEARKMKTIENAVADLGTEECIPLPSVGSRTLLQIQEFLKTGRVDTSSLIELLKAANYLHYEDLIYQLLPEWVNTTKYFPCSSELKELIPTALYFYRGKDWSIFKEYMPWEDLSNFIFSADSIPENCNIIMAARDNQLAVVNRLLRYPYVDPSALDNLAFVNAAANGHLSIVERLLQDSRVDPSTRHNMAIRLAASYGHVVVIERLLQDPRVDPSEKYFEAITDAAERRHLSVVERLLQDPRVDPSVQDNAAIKFAAEFGSLPVVERLLQDPRVDPAAHQNEATALAAEYGHVAVVECLLQDARVDPEVLKDFEDMRIQELYKKYRRKRQKISGI